MTPAYLLLPLDRKIGLKLQQNNSKSSLINSWNFRPVINLEILITENCNSISNIIQNFSVKQLGWDLTIQSVTILSRVLSMIVLASNHASSNVTAEVQNQLNYSAKKF